MIVADTSSENGQRERSIVRGRGRRGVKNKIREVERKSGLSGWMLCVQPCPTVRKMP